MASPFEDPIYVTRPLLPDRAGFVVRTDEIWESKQLTNIGNQHRELNRQLKQYLQVENLSLFNNGTMALLLGVKAMELEGEVITTPFTFPATVQALDWNGLTPVFCDIEPSTLTIDAEKIEALITEKTSAVLGVHVFGNPCDVEKIQHLADKHGLKVIYDGAHAFGSVVKGRPVSEWGDMTMFSFHATKLFHTIEGGAIAVKDGQLAQKMDLLKNFGLLNAEEVVLSGLNAKMNEIQAGVGLEVLKRVPVERAERQRIKSIYEQYLGELPGIRIITRLERSESSYQYFAIEIDEEKFGGSRDWVHQELQKYNVFTRKYFYPLCSEFSWYQHLESASPENLPVAHKAVAQMLTLPFYGELKTETVEEICAIFKELHLSLKMKSQA